ncbi:MAG: hypothetical protein KAT46_07520 [Deltaproteobacteria bacterium]|nr:hypothetical protein [Deltaproteobacteria bacterium]
MDWQKIKKFKKQFHRAREAFKALSVNRVSQTLYSDLSGEVHSRLILPPEKEISRLGVLVYPFANPESDTYLKTIVQIIFDADVPVLTSDEKEKIIKILDKIESSKLLIQFEDTATTARDSYLDYFKGEFFSNDVIAFRKIERFMRNPVMKEQVVCNFYSYSKNVYTVCVEIYSYVRKMEKLNRSDFSEEVHSNKDNQCIYCLSSGGKFTSEEHVYPESLCNGKIILPKGNVCDECNNGILSDLDNHLSNHEMLAFLKVFYMPIQQKTGKFPSATYQNMKVEKTHPRKISINMQSDSAKSVTLKEDGNFVNLKFKGIGRRPFNAVFLGRALYKVALGVLAWQLGASVALNKKYDLARDFILGKSTFTNNLLITFEVEPKGYIEGVFVPTEQGTLFALSIYGVTFAFNLEPSPVIDVVPELEKVHVRSYSLSA